MTPSNPLELKTNLEQKYSENSKEHLNQKTLQMKHIKYYVPFKPQTSSRKFTLQTGRHLSYLQDRPIKDTYMNAKFIVEEASFIYIKLSIWVPALFRHRPTSKRL